MEDLDFYLGTNHHEKRKATRDYNLTPWKSRKQKGPGDGKISFLLLRKYYKKVVKEETQNIDWKPIHTALLGCLSLLFLLKTNRSYSWQA